MESPDEADDVGTFHLTPTDSESLLSLLCAPFTQVKYRNTLRWIPYFIYGDEDEAMAAVADPVSHRLYGGTVGDSFLIF
ncbi:hypothetical protein NDU88_001584 [Pleurodeles waltl]|uniref:Uncharacterized protein n=1 Tax=Pleurodeles waltl TaxID=8319 RepID=A0AAV7Q7I4_PLEWA|nr:hypothetical protein NDU88_001584 [Pleurodeles waltl]